MDAIEKIAAWMDRDDLSQAQIVRLTGVSKQRLSAVLAKTYKLTDWSMIRAIAGEMKVSADYLMDPHADWPPPNSFEGRVLSRRQEKILEMAELLPEGWAEARLMGAPDPAQDVPLGEASGGYAKPVGFSKRPAEPAPAPAPASEMKPKGQDLPGRRRP